MTLKELHLKNIILVEKAHLLLDEGFTVISGETGSGKSAILEALGLVLGGRFDSNLIRQGESSASVEAVFYLRNDHPALMLLEDRGISMEDPCSLIVKRELSSQGKSRAFINHQPAQISLLKELGDLLIEIVAQHSTFKLLSSDHHRTLIDIYGNLETEAANFREKYELSQSMHRDLEKKKSTLPSRMREMESCERELNEIKEAALKEGEEEELFEEFSRLSNAEERSELATQLENALGSDRGILTQLKGAKHPLQKLQEHEPAMKSEWELFHTIVLEVEELLHTLRKYQSKVEPNPERLEKLNDRLTLINKLKMKYGSSLSDIERYRDQCEERLKELRRLDLDIAELESAYIDHQKSLSESALKLFEKRQKAATKLEKAVSEKLIDLNMPCAKLKTEFTPQSITSVGSHRIEFFLSANKGAPFLPLKEAASGGELARILLSIHLLLADNAPIETLIFDEIDANIGGTTASKIGEKLKELGKQIQVICITHFPQVAACGDHHFYISKSEKAQKTITAIEALDSREREEELCRMAGKC